jgi:Bacterial capsule synthesis protein PGA_cap
VIRVAGRTSTRPSRFARVTKVVHRRVAWLGVALAIGAALCLAGCGEQSGSSQAAGQALRPSVWVAPSVAGFVRRAVGEAIAAEPGRFVAARSEDRATLRVGYSARRAARSALAEVVLVPVVPFPTVADDVSWTAVRRFWRGDGHALARAIADGSAPTLYLTAATRAALGGLLGRPAPSARIATVAAERLLDTAWDARPAAWSIVPFDQLRPRWKALTLDGRSVFDRDLDVGRYRLVAGVGVEGPDAQTAALRRSVARGGRLTNRETDRMTVLMMTGVTALSRNIAAKMEAHGVTYPSRRIRHVLLDNDLLHISNEVSFAHDCPYPGPHVGTRFCSRPKYIELLRDVGADIIELSGNHNLDWGPEPARRTLDMYTKRRWTWFAGGRDHVEAHRPLTITHNGNRLAFIGCNPVGASYAWADRGRPGAATCDDEAMQRQVRDLRATGHLPIVTFQHWETYQYHPTAQQVADFAQMSGAGATIVSGSQAHHPQGFAFDEGRLVHYGLGNLFFDQMQTLGTRQEIVDKHVVYKGKHLSTQLFTFLLMDYSQPRPMTPAERRQLLASVFEASNW